MKIKRLHLILIISFTVLISLTVAGYFLLKDRLFVSPDNSPEGNLGGISSSNGFYIANQSNVTCTLSDECKVQGIINCGEAEPFCSVGFCACKSSTPKQDSNFVSASCVETMDFIESLNEAAFNPSSYENQEIKEFIEKEKGQKVAEMFRYNENNFDVVITTMELGDTCFIVGKQICYCGK